MKIKKNIEKIKNNLIIKNKADSKLYNKQKKE